MDESNFHLTSEPSCDVTNIKMEIKEEPTYDLVPHWDPNREKHELQGRSSDGLGLPTDEVETDSNTIKIKIEYEGVESSVLRIENIAAEGESINSKQWLSITPSSCSVEQDNLEIVVPQQVKSVQGTCKLTSAKTYQDNSDSNNISDCVRNKSDHTSKFGRSSFDRDYSLLQGGSGDGLQISTDQYETIENALKVEFDYELFESSVNCEENIDTDGERIHWEQGLAGTSRVKSVVRFEPRSKESKLNTYVTENGNLTAPKVDQEKCRNETIISGLLNMGTIPGCDAVTFSASTDLILGGSGDDVGIPTDNEDICDDAVETEVDYKLFESAVHSEENIDIDELSIHLEQGLAVTPRSDSSLQSEPSSAVVSEHKKSVVDTSELTTQETDKEMRENAPRISPVISSPTLKRRKKPVQDQHTCHTCSKCITQRKSHSKNVVTHTSRKSIIPETCSKDSAHNSIQTINTTLAGKKQYKCETCTRYFTTHSSLTKHMRSHSSVKEYICEICSTSFAMRSHLTKHLVTHSGIKQYKCEKCNKYFTHRSILTTHMLTHSGIKQYKCVTCGKCFAHRGSLSTHILTHSYIKLYKCEHCGRCFTHRGTLITHILAHSGTKQYKCRVCSRCFTKPSTLSTHMLIHSVIKQHKCDMCDKCYVHGPSLYRHKLTHAK